MLNTFLVSAQYFDVGMKWTYAHGVGFPAVSYEVHSIEITGDTLINGETWYVLDGRCNCSADIKMIRQEGQKVYYHWKDEKHLLYDYSLLAGDSLHIQFPFLINPDSMRDISMVIDTTEMNDFGGSEFKVQEMSYVGNVNFGVDFGQKFIEGLGSLDFCLFPQDGLCEEGSYLRCITFADGSTIKFTDDPDCYIVGTKDIELSGVSLWPNPVFDFLNIDNPDNHSFDIQVFNLQGQLIFAQKGIHESNQKITTKDWLSGAYLVKLTSEKGVFTRVIVTENR